MTTLPNASTPGEPGDGAPAEAVAPNEEQSASETPATPDLTAIRELVLQAHPDVVPELIAGDTIDDLLGSVQPARDAYQRIASTIRQVPPAPSVPAGGERPMPVDPMKIPSSEKIRRGLARSNR